MINPSRPTDQQHQDKLTSGPILPVILIVIVIIIVVVIIIDDYDDDNDDSSSYINVWRTTNLNPTLHVRWWCFLYQVVSSSGRT